MLKSFVLWVGCCFLLYLPVLAADYTDQEARAAWDHWKRQPITESNFLAICDLMQDIGKTNIHISYDILSEYEPMVQKTGNREWVHILLMGWARAKEALLNFGDAEALYRRALDNSAGDVRRYDEVLVGLSLMYAEWGKTDSLEKYDSLGKRSAAQAGDRENLSFLYTFGAVGRGSSGAAGQVADTAAMSRDLTRAMQLADGLADKNALFTARYNYATIYCQNDPQREVTILESLLELAKDSTLTHKPRLYQRTDFYFRNAAPSIYSQLMQVNLLLADYENAWKFGELLYNAVVAPNPHAPQAPFWGYALGVLGDIPLANPKWSIRPALSFQHEASNADIFDNGTYIRVNYFHLAIDAVYHPDFSEKRWTFGLGPWFAYGLSGKYTQQGYTYKIDFGSSDLNDAHHLDFGLDVMAAFVLKPGMSLTAKFDYGLKDVSAQSDFVTIYTRSFGLTFVYWLPCTMNLPKKK